MGRILGRVRCASRLLIRRTSVLATLHSHTFGVALTVNACAGDRNGYVRVKHGSLALEESCAWAVPGTFTAPENDNQYHCYEDGSNCKA